MISLNDIANKSLRLTAGLILIIAIILCALNRLEWVIGFLVGSIWAIVDFWLTINILNIAILKQPKQKLYLNVLIKFPLLYLVGFLILISKRFILSSLLTGLGVVFIIMGVTITIWASHKQEKN